MDAISMAEAKAHLSSLVHRAEAGDSIDITRRGKLVARLTAASAPRKRIDVSLLQALTSAMPRQAQDAAEIVREIGESDRY